MIIQFITRNRALSAFVIACAMAASTAQPATAQTAGNVACDGCVGSRDLKDNGIRSKDIRDGQVKNADIARNAITNSKIANGAVTGNQVANGSLSAVDLGDEAGVDFALGADERVLEPEIEMVVGSVTVTAPGPGFVILNASGRFLFLPNASVVCSLTTGLSVEFFDQQVAGNITSGPHDQFFGMTEGFVVPAGSTTFNVVCEGFGSNLVVDDVDVTAIYAPTRY